MNKNIIINEKIEITAKGISGNGISGNGISGNGLNELDFISSEIEQMISTIRL